MAERSHALRVLQHHLRQAGTLIASGDLDAASAHVDAALAIDPASPAALTLRDRIAVTRSASAAARPSPVPLRPAAAPDLHPTPAPDTAPSRFVPTGVDPVSWVNFESRIEERRFRSLLATAQQAVARGDGLAARLALEEARELRPDAPEMSALDAQVAMMPIAAPVEVSGTVFRARTLRAASILVFGVTLVMTIDWLRSDPATVAESNATWELDTPVMRDEPGLAANVTRRPVELPAFADSPEPELTSDDRVLQPATETNLSANQIAVAGTSLDAGTAPRPADNSLRAIRPEELVSVGTTAATRGPATVIPSVQPPVRDVETPVSTREVPDDFVAPRNSASNQTALARAGAPRGEIPDDYVAPQSSRQTPPAAAPPALPQLSSVTRADTPSVRDIPAATPARSRSSSNTLPPATGSASRPRADEPAETARATERAEAAPAAGAGAVVPDSERALTHVLEQYADVYERLDARAAKQIWPTVPERALADAFDGLESQRVTFDHCDISVDGDRARASCRGTLSYVVKVGNGQRRNDPRSWEIGFKRDGADWVIDSVQVSR